MNVIRNNGNIEVRMVMVDGQSGVLSELSPPCYLWLGAKLARAKTICKSWHANPISQHTEVCVLTSALELYDLTAGARKINCNAIECRIPRCHISPRCANLNVSILHEGPYQVSP